MNETLKDGECQQRSIAMLSYQMVIWLVVDLPLWKVLISQLGWWHPKISKNNKCSKPPTSNSSVRKEHPNATPSLSPQLPWVPYSPSSRRARADGHEGRLGRLRHEGASPTAQGMRSNGHLVAVGKKVDASRQIATAWYRHFISWAPEVQAGWFLKL